MKMHQPVTKQEKSMTGEVLKEAFSAATDWLEKSVKEIDALNVFPVPDGDTGTNMLLTMRSSLEEAYRNPDGSVSEVARFFARGALLGARGNSGVILSQILSGLAAELAAKKDLDAQTLAKALDKACESAYRVLQNPVEGTMLTVIKEAANAALEKTGSGETDVISVLETAVNAANKAVANTPNLLPVLKESGVVDAGGQGLYTILEGVLRYLKGETPQMQTEKPQIIESGLVKPEDITDILAHEMPYGYCTEFVIKGQNLEPDKIREKLSRKGQSLIVAGEEKTVKIHVHTKRPGDILNYAISLGTLSQLSIRNMDEQYRDFLKMQKKKPLAGDFGIVSAALGDGWIDVFNNLGATAVVRGGQTMNPSVADLRQAIDSITSEKIMILPNDKNVINTANLVKSLTSKEIAVIPTESLPQGVSVLTGLDYNADFDTNVKLANQARTKVKTIEITRATRSTEIAGLPIKEGQFIALLDGDLVAADGSALDVIRMAFGKLKIKSRELVTIYTGADAKEEETEKITRFINGQNSKLEIEVVSGGQPHYPYIISVE